MGEVNVETGTALIKNYQENVISLNVTPKTNTVMTTKHLYKIEAVLCEDQQNGPPFTQGTMIGICITPDDFASRNGIIIQSIDDFNWMREEDSTISQPAIIRANTPSNNGLTLLHNTNNDGTEYRLESVLFASFYTTAGAVLGTGSATF